MTSSQTTLLLLLLLLPNEGEWMRCCRCDSKEIGPDGTTITSAIKTPAGEIDEAVGHNLGKRLAE